MLGLTERQYEIARDIARKRAGGWADLEKSETLAILNAGNANEVARILSNHKLWALIHRIMGDELEPEDVWLAADMALEKLDKILPQPDKPDNPRPQIKRI